MLKFKIIASGSEGNAIVLDNTILIDCGVPYSKVKDFNIKYVFLTHEHSDHINLKTLQKLEQEKKPKFIVPAHLALIELNNKLIVEAGKIYKNNELAFRVEPLYHNVPNVGYTLLYKQNKILYATDTNRLDHIKAYNYDYYFIECNHDYEFCLKKIKEAQQAGVYTHLQDSIHNHLSEAKYFEFILDNATPESTVIPMHRSNTGFEN